MKFNPKEFIVEVRETPVCDFCSSKDVKWWYRAEPFIIGPDKPLMGFDPDWAACESCSNLIEQEKFIELAERAPQCKHEHDPETKSILMMHVMMMHQMFFKSKGPRIPIEQK